MFKPKYQLQQNSNIQLSMINEQRLYESEIPFYSWSNDEAQQKQEFYYQVVYSLRMKQHFHTQICPLAALVEIIQMNQRQQDTVYAILLSYLQYTRLRDIFCLLLAGLECKRCYKKYLQYLVKKYHKLLQTILWYKERSLGNIQQCQGFYQVTSCIIKYLSNNQSNNKDVLWTRSIKYLKDQWLNEKQKDSRQINLLNNQNSFSLNQKHQKHYQNCIAQKEFTQYIARQLRFYQITYQLIKLVGIPTENNLLVAFFYQKYIKSAQINDLKIINKIIRKIPRSLNLPNNFEQRIGKFITNRLSQQTLIPKIQVQNVHAHQPIQIKMQNNLPVKASIPKNKIQMDNTFLKLKKTQSLCVPANQVQQKCHPVSVENKKEQSKQAQIAPKVSINPIKTFRQAEQQLNIYCKEKQQTSKGQLLKNKTSSVQIQSLNSLKIKNISGNDIQKVETVQKLLQKCIQNPQLVSVAFSNSLVCFKQPQCSNKLNQIYKNSCNQSKKQFKKELYKNKRQLKSLYQLFKFD